MCKAYAQFTIFIEFTIELLSDEVTYYRTLKILIKQTKKFYKV